MTVPPGAQPTPSSTLTPDQREEVERQYAVLTRGAAQVLPQGGLKAHLAASLATGRPLRVKFGVDPSGSELTLGHAVVLRTLRRFQDCGHTAVLLIGDFTGQVGDPTGRSAVRKELSLADTTDNAARYVEQAMLVLSRENLEIRRNTEWLAAMTMSDVIREARELTVARLLERDDFAKRYKAQESISLVEFLYPLLQGYDSVALEADVELGGTDQTYNLLVGRDLQKAHGQREQIVLTVPLLEGIDGGPKMSKSLGNYVALEMSPDEQFGRVMRIPDALVGQYARLCTDLSLDECAGLEADALAGGPAANRAKRTVARSVVDLYHRAGDGPGSPSDGSPGAGTTAEARFDAVFAKHETPDDVPSFVLPPGDPVFLPTLLGKAGLGWAASSSEARRLVDGGAVKIDGTAQVSGAYDVSRATLVGAVLMAGRRRMARLVEG